MILNRLFCRLIGRHTKNLRIEYLDENSCDRVFICEHCDFTMPVLLEHQFGEWSYIEHGSCIQKRECKRCHISQENKSLQHQFGGWSYIEHDSCIQKRECQRDHYEEKRTKHRNLRSNEKECIVTETCNVCKYENKYENHRYEEVVVSEDGEYLGTNYYKGVPIDHYSERVTMIRCEKCWSTPD